MPTQNRRPQRQPQQGLLYQPVVPNMTGLGDDIDQIANQLYQYQREKEVRKQQRRDMMMQQFMQMTDVQRPEVTKANIQKEIDKRYNSLFDKLTSIVKEDEMDWEDIQQGRQYIGQYYSDISEPMSWQQQWERDREMVKKEPEDWSEETLRGIANYKGKGPPDYPVKKRIPEAHILINKWAKSIKDGGLEAATILNMDATQIIQADKEGKAYWWVIDEETGEPTGERKPSQYRRAKALLGSKRKYQRSFLKELKESGKLVDPDEGIYQWNGQYYSIEEKDYNGIPVKNLDRYFIDRHIGELFPITAKTRRKLVEENKDSDLTQTEIKHIHRFSKGQREETFGKEKFETFIGLGQSGLSGTAAFDEVTDPLTGKTVDIGDEKGGKTRDYQVIGIDPIEKKMLIALEGSDLKRTPFGKEMPEEMKSKYQQLGMGGAPDIKQSRMAVVDANRYRNLLEQEKFYDEETGELIFSGGTGIRPKLEEEDTEEQQKEDPLGILE